MRLRKTVAISVASILSVALAACGSSSSGGSSGPIVVGSINTLSGPVTFPEASQAAQAVFNQVNASGGINGRKISYMPLDDQGNPSTAAQYARKLISENNAVAMAGSASLLDCEVNSTFYGQSSVSSIPGVGVDPGCFASPSIAPANTGPYLGTQVILQYASEQLKLKHLCAFIVVIAGTGNAYKKAISDWSASTGKRLILENSAIPATTTDFTPFVLAAKQAGCDGIMVNGVQPQMIAWAKAMQAQNMKNATLLALSSTYTVQAAAAIGNPGFPMYAASEFAPYTDANSSANADWRSLMTRNKIPLTSFSQGGYLAATYLVQVLKSIKGPITAKTVTSALKAMSPINNPMVGTPYVFGNATTHNPNRAITVVSLKNGAWTTVPGGWVIAKS